MLQARLDAGLFTLQQAALIIGLLWAMGDVGLRKRLLSSLHLKSQSLAAAR
jgi:beta-catenin-like protein 1